MLFAVKKNIFFLKFLKDFSEDLPGYKEVVLAAVKKNGLALEHASDSLKVDKEVVLEAVKKNGLALKHASANLREDTISFKEGFLAILKKYISYLQNTSADLKADKEVVLAAVKQDFRAL